MIDALALVAYAVAAGTIGAAWLRGAQWTHRSPRLGIFAWQALSLNIVVGAGLAAVSLAIGLPHVSSDLAGLIDTCATTLRMAYAAPGGSIGSLSGIAVLAALTARLLWASGRTLVADGRERRRTTATIDLIGRRDVVPGAIVLDHPAPYAFCIPGHQHRIVLTSAAVSTLTGDQLRAVLAHERAHVHGRHHLPLSLSRALAVAFPIVPAFRHAEAEVALLVELLADDTARHRVGAMPLGDALGSFTQSPAPRSALAASAQQVEHRISRLSHPVHPLRGVGRLVALAMIGLGLGLPFTIVAAPAIAAVTSGLCLIG